VATLKWDVSVRAGGRVYPDMADSPITEWVRSRNIVRVRQR
jgi:hypothetical protein